MKKENVVVTYDTPSPALRASSPSRGEGNNSCFLLHLREKVGGARMRGHLRAFTLIELLVVVLIIGILAAVAVPQYQKAVEKTQAAEAFALLKAVAQAQESYFLVNGEYADKFEQLDITLPAEYSGTEGVMSNSNVVTDTRSNDRWSIQILFEGTLRRVEMNQWTGAYQGSGISYRFTNVTKKWICEERKLGVIFAKTPGAFCEKIMNASFIKESDGERMYYL